MSGVPFENKTNTGCEERFGEFTNIFFMAAASTAIWTLIICKKKIYIYI